MEFNNLECNILYLLGLETSDADTGAPLEMQQIAQAFSDIPQKNVKAALLNLEKHGLLNTRKNTFELFLTPKGIAAIKSIYRCVNLKAKSSGQRVIGCC